MISYINKLRNKQRKLYFLSILSTCIARKFNLVSLVNTTNSSINNFETNSRHLIYKVNKAVVQLSPIVDTALTAESLAVAHLKLIIF